MTEEQLDRSHAAEQSHVLAGFDEAIERIPLLLREAREDAAGFDLDAVALSLDSIDLAVEELRQRLAALRDWTPETATEVP